MPFGLGLEALEGTDKLMLHAWEATEGLDEVLLLRPTQGLAVIQTKVPKSIKVLGRQEGFNEVMGKTSSGTKVVNVRTAGNCRTELLRACTPGEVHLYHFHR